MASSLQNEDIDKSCEQLIKCFCEEEKFSDKIVFLTSLTYKVLPNIELFEIEHKYFAKVVPKVCEEAVESFAKLINLAQNLTNQNKSNDTLVEDIHSYLKSIVSCLECLESCALHVSQSTPNYLSIQQIHSLHPGSFSIILATFSHCKESESLYGNYFPCFSEDLSSLFKKAFQLQKVLMEILEKVQLDDNTNIFDAKEMTTVCHSLLGICVLISDIDVGLLVNTWKVLSKLVLKHKVLVKNGLDIERVICHLCDSIKLILHQCINMSTTKKGQDQQQIEFTESNEAKSFTKLVKALRFLIGNLMHIVKDYCDILSTGLHDILGVLITVYSSMPPCLSALPVVPDVLSEIMSGVLVVIKPLLRILISNKSFVTFVRRQSTVNRLTNTLGLSRVLLDIGALLPGECEEVFTMWMAPTNSLEEEPCFSLLQAIIETLKQCRVELHLPIYMDSIVCAEKPSRNVSIYEIAVTILSSLIACTPTSCFSFIENSLLENLIGRDFFSMVLATDLWTFMSRWGSAELCSQHIHFLISLMCNLPNDSIIQTHVAILVRRLTYLLAKDHQEHILSHFPPYKVENLLIWSVLPLNTLQDSIQSKICCKAVPICIKQCNEKLLNQQMTLSFHAVLCLEAVYSVNNLLHLIPPVHHAAVVDFVTSVWNQDSQKLFQLQEDICMQFIKLTACVLPFLLPGNYAKIIVCLSDLLNRSSTNDIKVAIAKFLGQCGSQQVKPDMETDVLGNISSLFSTLLNEKTWLVYQISLESVKAFAEVTPYSHIMGQCVPEHLLSSLSDFLSGVPFRQGELSVNKTQWLKELLQSHLFLQKTSPQSGTSHEEHAGSAAASLEPHRKRMKQDISDSNKSYQPYKEIVQTLNTQVSLLNNLHTSHEPNQYVLHELQDILLKLKRFVDHYYVNY